MNDLELLLKGSAVLVALISWTWAGMWLEGVGRKRTQDERVARMILWQTPFVGFALAAGLWWWTP